MPLSIKRCRIMHDIGENYRFNVSSATDGLDVLHSIIFWGEIRAKPYSTDLIQASLFLFLFGILLNYFTF